MFTERADHNSQILFVEEWLEAHGYKNVQTENITPWRRQHMSNLVNAFDFDHPDYSIPTIASAPTPLRNWNQPKVSDGLLGALYGNYIGAARCWSRFKYPRPPPPYGPENENSDVTKLTEEGFKQVRGQLTEGRYLTFEMDGMALTKHGESLFATGISVGHRDIRQRWVLHQQGPGISDIFTISSAASGKYVGSGLALTEAEQAISLTIVDLGNGKGYTISTEDGRYLTVGPDGKLLYSEQPLTGFNVFSVTYHS